MSQPLGLPAWLVAGLALGAAFAVLAALLFLVGPRLLPAPDTDRGRRATADERRREEIRGYLRYVGESFAEDHPVAGETVAFYLPRRDVAITFDARAYFRIRGSGTHAVLVEHELPGSALGPRLPFETPEPGPAGAGGPVDTPPAAPGEGDPTAAAFAALGVPAGADLETVRAAYREQVKAVHPDQGGDPEAFRRLREAYAVAREAAS